MGLDIRVFKNLKVVENPILNEYGYPVNDNEWTPGGGMEWSETHFPSRGEGIDASLVYTFEDEFDFRAGSYSGYNWWRDRLNEISDGKSFMELIDFADNEGVIGFVVSKKLAKDFADNMEKAEAFSKTLSYGDMWFEKYMLWKEAFKMAQENGAVAFC